MNAVLPWCTVNDIADFIKPQDKLPILLALSLNTQLIQQKDGFILRPEFRKPRSAVWYNPKTQTAIVGLRATDPFQPEFTKEIHDNQVIAGFNPNGLDLTREASQAVLELQRMGVRNIILVGHSLGGTAALQTASQFPMTRAISLFGGALATNPITTGPGPLRATHYHIVGDLISTHVSPKAADVVRVKKQDSSAWGFTYPHLTGRILKMDRAWRIVSPDEEQQEWLAYGYTDPTGSRQQIVLENPIPGSSTVV